MARSKPDPLRPPRDIIEFATSDKYLGDTSYSVPQMALIKALYGHALSKEEMACFLAMHEDQPPRAGGYDAASFGLGRRSGKGEKLGALFASYEAVTFDPRYLSPGETAYGILIAQNEKQARILRDFIEAKLKILEDKGFTIFEEVAAQAKAITAEQIRLANRVVIQCFPCKKVSVRGVTAVFNILDEIGHWQLEENAYNADVEIMRAIRPTRATLKSRGLKVPLICTSTPFDEIGVFYDQFKNRHRSRMLVVHQVPTKYLNPSITNEYLEGERIDDPEAFEREYLAKWGSGAQSKLFTREMIDACTDVGRVSSPPDMTKNAVAHIDAAFKHDYFPLGIGWLTTDDLVHIGFLRAWKPRPGVPLSMEEVVSEQAAILLGYGLDKVYGDQFCDVPLREEYARNGVTFIERPVNESNKFIEYRNLLAVSTARRVRFVDNEDIARDLMGLRKKGKQIAAPTRKNAHDDVSGVLRRIVYDLLPMTNRVGIEELNRDGKVMDRETLMRERGFTPPPDPDSERLPTGIMAEVY